MNLQIDKLKELCIHSLNMSLKFNLICSCIPGTYVLCIIILKVICKLKKMKVLLPKKLQCNRFEIPFSRNHYKTTFLMKYVI